MTRQISLLLVTIVMATCLLAYSRASPSGVKVELKNAQGESVGTATLSREGKGVRIKLELRNLPPGEHAIHIHQLAKCEGAEFSHPPDHISTLMPSSMG